MKLASIKDFSTVDGPGLRLVLFLTGCPHNCDGCHNPELQDYNYGVDWKIEDIVEYIEDRRYWIDGITLSGGEPLFQLNAVKELLTLLRSNDNTKYLNVIIYTGYMFEQIPNDIKTLTDIIIDGKYEKSLPPTKYADSSNQRIFQKVMGKHFKEVDANELSLPKTRHIRAIYRTNAKR